MDHAAAENMRVIAFDVRYERLGYVVLDGTARLVDWDITRFQSGAGHVDRVRRLVSFFQPSVVVLRTIEKGSWRVRPGLRRIVRSIDRRLHSAGVPIAHIRDAKVKSTFRQRAAATKEEIARLIADCFPELAWQLPPRRKPWQPENRRISIFDAAALGLAYLAEIDPDAVDELIAGDESIRGPSKIT
jgi:hypothetical protein